MKKITTILITILCVMSLTSCKNKVTASKEEAKEKFELILASNFQNKEYGYYYTIQTKDTSSYYGNEAFYKTKAKGCIEYKYDTEKDREICNYSADVKMKYKTYDTSTKNEYGYNVSGKEETIILDAKNDEEMEFFVWKKVKVNRLDAKEKTTYNIKTKEFVSYKASLDKFFADCMLNMVIDFKPFLEEIFKIAEEYGLIYIIKDSCKITINGLYDTILNYNFEKVDIEIKLDGDKMKTVKITYEEPSKECKFTIDFTKTVKIEKPKDYQDYI